MNKKSFYITTPIFYPSAKLHIGNAFTVIFCDVISRYKRLLGYDVFFLTGLDEHGQKIEKKAINYGISSKEYVDKMYKYVVNLWDKLDIKYSKFIRTTDKFHEKTVSEIFDFLLKKDDIYLGKYKGWYSVSDEEFINEKQLKDIKYDNYNNIISAKTSNGNFVEYIEEDVYFFRMSKYKKKIENFLKNNKNFIQPNFRMNEILNNFINIGINDLAVSRTKFKWGINLKNNSKHIIYVWIDALFNYITALNYQINKKENYLFKKYWPAIHVIGKEIVRFHSIYWPILLMALDLPMPKKIYSHGWLLINKNKMSKSKNKVIYPEVFINRYNSPDYLRYYLLSILTLNKDGIFDIKDFIEKVNSYLVNDLSNLINRILVIICKKMNIDIILYKFNYNFKYNLKIKLFVDKCIKQYYKYMNNFEISKAIKVIFKIVSYNNKYLDNMKPWLLLKKMKNNKEKLNNILINIIESIRIISILLFPIIPGTSKRIFKKIFFGKISNLFLDFSNLKFGNLKNIKNVKIINNNKHLFSRLDFEIEMSYFKKNIY